MDVALLYVVSLGAGMALVSGFLWYLMRVQRQLHAPIEGETPPPPAPQVRRRHLHRVPPATRAAERRLIAAGLAAGIPKADLVHLLRGSPSWNYRKITRVERVARANDTPPPAAIATSVPTSWQETSQ